MLGRNENLKDLEKKSVKDTSSSIAEYEVRGFSLGSYTKINKLITALYMVTDIIEKEEPLRTKLRKLGADLISDTHSFALASNSELKVLLDMEKSLSEIMSFLEIARTVDLISEMNSGILKKEFLILKDSVQDLKIKNSSPANNPVWLEEFLMTNDEEGGVFREEEKKDFRFNNRLINKNISIKENNKMVGRIGHNGPTRIGLQRGGTLLQALNNIGNLKTIKDNSMSDRASSFKGHGLQKTEDFHAGFEALKKQRREQIIKIVKDKPDGVSIKDIALVLRSLGEERSEKTLQRELVSMVSDSVLKKSGDKRWSRYSIKN